MYVILKLFRTTYSYEIETIDYDYFMNEEIAKTACEFLNSEEKSLSVWYKVIKR